MKKIIFTILLSIGALSLFSQNICDPDNRIYEKYSQERVKMMQQKNPRMICLKNYELNAGYEIISPGNDKLSAMPPLRYYNYKEKEYEGKVTQIDLQNFNLYDYMYKRHYSKTNYYRIGNTNKALVIPPQKRFTKKFNQYYEKLY